MSSEDATPEIIAVSEALGTFGNILVARKSNARDYFNIAIARMSRDERILLGRMIVKAYAEIKPDGK